MTAQTFDERERAAYLIGDTITTELLRTLVGQEALIDTLEGLDPMSDPDHIELEQLRAFRDNCFRAVGEKGSTDPATAELVYAAVSAGALAFKRRRQR